jgi:histone-lysine N-methyltransferase SETMAR
MTRVHDFVVDLAKGGKSFGEIKKLVDDVYGDKALKKTQIYEILKRVKMGKNTEDRRGFNKQKTKMTAGLIASVAAAVAEDRRVSIQDLARAHGTSYGTISRILHSQLGLVKKSARWVPKLLSKEQKEERVRTSKEFVKLIQTKGRSVLDRIITMDESSVSMHTPETKQQSKQWLKKGTPGPVKARVHASRTKTMVLAFFDSQGMVYTNYVPRGSTVNAKYIIRALGTFLKNLKKKRPETAKGEWFLHWDNAPVHTANVVKEFLAKKNIKLLSHPPYSPDLAPADYFLFPKLKKELAGNTMTQEEFKKEWEGVLRGVSKDEFAKAFVRWFERCEKCIRIDGDYVEKS